MPADRAETDADDKTRRMTWNMKRFFRHLCPGPSPAPLSTQAFILKENCPAPLRWLRFPGHWSPKLFQAFRKSSSKIGSIFTTNFRRIVAWRVTSKLRGSTLIQVARRRSKVFQRFSASLVRVGDVQSVPRRHFVRSTLKKNKLGGFLGG